MERVSSTESLEARLCAAAVNSKLNSERTAPPNLNRFLKFVKPSQTDGMDSRSLSQYS